jgi:hypothetical protein
LVKLDTSPTARKYRRCRSSIEAFQYAEKAWLLNEYSISPFNALTANCAQLRGITKNMMSKHVVAIRSVSPRARYTRYLSPSGDLNKVVFAALLK